MIVPEIIYNLSLLGVLLLVSNLLNDRFDAASWKGRVAQGVLFGAIAVVGMSYPFTFVEGVIFDGRTIVVGIATIFFGPLTGAISVIMTILFRIWLGGDGVIMGMMTTLTAFVLGWVFHVVKQNNDNGQITLPQLFVYSMMVHLMMAFYVHALPENIADDVFQNVAISFVVIYPLITIIIGKVLNDHHRGKEYVGKLQQSEEKFRLLIESSDDVIFTMDTDLRHTGVYGTWMKRINMEPEDFIGKRAADIVGEKEGQWHETCYRKALSGEVVVYEWETPAPDGMVKYQSKVSPIRNREGEIIGIVGIGRNITELKETQKKLARSLREKDVLLSEIHHRVKNNMAIISSLLSLQSEYIANEEARSIFRDTENRIRSMALVHEIVYEQTDFVEINAAKLISRIVDLLSNSFGLESRGIRVETDLEEIILDFNHSVPCTLLINELITNAARHAFRNHGEGTIFVRLSRANGKNEIEISDDGVGVDNVDQLYNPVSFGTTIIHGLVQQLRGDISFESNGGGLTVNIRF